ncbi:MAG: hypothetical protein WD904_05255 [Dehalococcoidia bacterium]
MTEEKPRPKLKFQLAAFPERYSLPARPVGSAAVQDAHRQTNFLLPDDLILFERAMNVQLQVVAANAKGRTLQHAGLFTLWSRAYSALADSCVLVTQASYASAAPLLRAALDCIAVQRALIASGYEPYEEWYAGAVTQVKERLATAFDLGRYRSAEMLIGEERLGPLYRLLTDLAMPHFGSSALLVAPDSNAQKLSAGFADNAFHLGWAELTMGWLLELASAQVATALSTEELKLSKTLRSDCEAAVRDVGVTLASKRRCYVEPLGDRFMFFNFRRTATGQPRRIIL